IAQGFSPDHIPPDTDLVVIGNAVRKDNPEVAEVARRNLRYLSFPAALEEMYLKDRTNVVVAGTHGKTTTCSLVTWILHHAGLSPGFLVGGILRNFDASSGEGKGPYFVVEGDEYHTAFFDRVPKFLHYRPAIGILTSVDFDHADIFSGIEDCIREFARFAALIPSRGRLIACADNRHIREIVATPREAPVETYGTGAGALWRLTDYRDEGEGSAFFIVRGGERFAVRSPLSGIHNALNTTAAFAAARALGVDPDRILDGITGYGGVKRRQEVRGIVDGIAVIDDFAHHPTEVRETIAAIRGRYPGRRLWAVWEPRTNSSRRSFFQEQYPEAFLGAAEVIVAGVYHAEQIEPGQRFSPERLAADIRARGGKARAPASAEEILKTLLGELRCGDVVLVMSNGAFDNIHERVLAGLRARRS
ncbi:MAG: Mur ligase family protein, partial [Candidatus Aureabacteria bacterium]|nr:Mur ligase family protein [Candidatus Auribacterota bacterium]